MEGAHIFLIVLASWIGISLSVAGARVYCRRPPEPQEDSDVQMFIFNVVK